VVVHLDPKFEVKVIGQSSWPQDENMQLINWTVKVKLGKHQLWHCGWKADLN